MASPPSTRDSAVRILVLSPQFPPEPGGIGNHCHDVARAWSLLRHDVTVVTRRAPLPQERPVAPFRIVDVPYTRNRVLRTLRFAWLSRRLLRAETFDLVYSGHWRTCGLPARLALGSLRARPCIVQAIHGTEVVELLGSTLRSRLLRLLWIWTVRPTTVFATFGDGQRHLLERLDIARERILVTPHGVDASRLSTPSDEVVGQLLKRYALDQRRVLVTVSRLVERKGHDTVIQALPIIARQVPDVAYLVVGEGETEGDLRRLAADVGVADRVVFSGRVEESLLAAHYALGDVFVMASRDVGADTEGFGISFIEAAVCGKAAIGGRSGGVEGAIVDGKTGLVVSPDSPTEVAEAAIRLLTDRSLAQRMGAAGRARALTELRSDVIAERILAEATHGLRRGRPENLMSKRRRVLRP